MYMLNQTVAEPGLPFWGQSLPLPLLHPFPLFPLSFLSFPLLSLSPSLPPLPSPSSPHSQYPARRGGGLGSAVSSGRKSIFSIMRRGNVSRGNDFASFCADKMSMETAKRTYLTVILANCYSSEEVQHQGLNLLFVLSQTIYISHGANKLIH